MTADHTPKSEPEFTPEAIRRVLVAAFCAPYDPANLRALCQHCNLSRNGSRAGQLAAALGASGEVAPSRKW